MVNMRAERKNGESVTASEATARTQIVATSEPIRVGSEAHCTLFCRMLLDTFDPYKPEVIDWPDLEPDALARLRALPFWRLAVETEDKASVHIGAMAAATSDPLIREALELIAFEEARHRRVLDALIARYGIDIDIPPPYVAPPQVERNFMSTGYGECLDSFFAFGLFEVARRSGFFAPELVQTFEPVIQEEARHIVFFVNWAAYTQRRKGLGAPLFAVKRLYHIVLNALERSGVALGGDDELAGEGRGAVGVDIGLREFMQLCLDENQRRMSHLDPRLLRPQIMPRAVRLALLFVR
jgi:hypothetical protein